MNPLLSNDNVPLQLNIYMHRDLKRLRCRIYHERTRVLETYFLQFSLLKNSNYIIITIYFDKFFANHNIKYLYSFTQFIKSELFRYRNQHIYRNIFCVAHIHMYFFLFFLYLLRKVQNSTCVRDFRYAQISGILIMINFKNKSKNMTKCYKILQKVAM